MAFQFDHRLLADEMEIYFLDEQIGAGLPVWLPNGVAIRDELEKFVKELEREAGFQRVSSPHVGRSILYEKSGHLKNFGDDMFPPIKAAEGDYYLKPMNCPHHHKIFASSPRSFRQLPLRLAEYGQVYRYENSGSLRGLSRARGLCQNDAHIYLDPKDALPEVLNVLDMHEECYRMLGLKGHSYRLSKSAAGFEPSPLWPEAEEILRKALRLRKLPFVEAEGEAAFYGPKIDVQMQLAHGQEESIASVQIDIFSAERFDLSFIASDGSSQRPWIIHRAPLGSHERFVSLLLEYYDGQLPGWLAPIQVYVIPLGEPDEKFIESLQADLRVKVDKSGGSLAKRLKVAHKCRPFAIVVMGEKEKERVKIQFREAAEKAALADVAGVICRRLKEKE